MVTHYTAKYATLLRNIADRAGEALQQDAPEGRCEILVRLYNDYLRYLQDQTDEDLAAFDSIEWERGESPEMGLTEVMIRAEHLAAWLDADRGAGRRLRFEMPPIPSVSGVVDRERLEAFSREMQDWAVSVSERAARFSRELSHEVPERIARYFCSHAGDMPCRGERTAGGKKSWRLEILTRVEKGDLTADEALRLLNPHRCTRDGDQPSSS